ncbi:LINE-1 retrotransposable element ORF2 protein [Caerostris darwini]|uniref:LINE-1 retrotransposable element ORF2 protein n=1 Tax=Caerostris darwini TaxID=1538125 RepID=A0AAV4TNN1_9ARAC|nr:LINE-1 retrotransposable element ORF2 protein [Caerostris darwini]
MKNVHNLLMYQPDSEPSQTPLLPDSENKVPIHLCAADETRGPLYHLKEQFDGILVQHPTNENFELFENIMDEFTQSAMIYLYPDGLNFNSSPSSSPKLTTVRLVSICTREIVAALCRKLLEIVCYRGALDGSISQINSTFCGPNLEFWLLRCCFEGWFSLCFFCDVIPPFNTYLSFRFVNRLSSTMMILFLCISRFYDLLVFNDDFISMHLLDHFKTVQPARNFTSATDAGLFVKFLATRVKDVRSHSCPCTPSFECWEGGTSDPHLYSSSGSEGRVELLDNEFTAKEVWAILKKAENTAPGPDRLTYHHLRLIDPGAKLLTKIFNLCVRFRKVPSNWKSSMTILIPKGGDPLEIANWRPIALSNTSYKTFMKCLASRLSAWCERYDVLSFCQKGFTPYDGVLEHNFIIERARSSKKDICIAWLDVTNAFGALPHSALFDSLRGLNVGEPLAIPIRSGVKQGCPLSGLLCNIAIDPVIRSLQDAFELHKVLAFADDLCLLSNSPSGLQDMLDLLNHEMNRLGLRLNPNKSFAYHLQGFTPVGTRDTSFFINNHRLISIKEGEFHKFLGKPVGFNAVANYSSLNDLAELLSLPLQS